MKINIIAILLLLLLTACAKTSRTDPAMYYNSIDKQVSNQKEIANKFSEALIEVARQSDTIGDNTVIERERTIRTESITNAISETAEMVHIDIAAPPGFVFKRHVEHVVNKLPEEINMLPNNEDLKKDDNYEDVKREALLKLNGED